MPSFCGYQLQSSIDRIVECRRPPIVHRGDVKDLNDIVRDSSTGWVKPVTVGPGRPILDRRLASSTLSVNWPASAVAPRGAQAELGQFKAPPASTGVSRLRGGG